MFECPQILVCENKKLWEILYIYEYIHNLVTLVSISLFSDIKDLETYFNRTIIISQDDPFPHTEHSDNLLYLRVHLYALKVHLHEIFDFCFFFIKSTHLVPWLIP
jgi:hypothetical protein